MQEFGIAVDVKLIRAILAVVDAKCCDADELNDGGECVMGVGEIYGDGDTCVL